MNIYHHYIGLYRCVQMYTYKKMERVSQQAPKILTYLKYGYSHIIITFCMKKKSYSDFLDFLDFFFSTVSTISSTVSTGTIASTTSIDSASLSSVTTGAASGK